jgi:hypothetical protein
MKNLRVYLLSDIPLLLWGAPGTGKTESIKAVAREDNAHMETLIGSTMDPIDVGGFNALDAKGNVKSSAPPWAVRIREALQRGQQAWLFLDELSCAPPAVQAALLRVVQERKVGDCDISGCRVVAAANPAETAADGGYLAASTANRWAHVEFTVEAKNWIAGTLRGWGVAPKTKAEQAATTSITGWIQHSPAALLSPPKGDAASRAWPSPRSWTAAIRLLSRAHGFADQDRYALVGSVVGDAAAQQWHTWEKSLDLPDPEEVLAGIAKIPSRGDQASVTISSMVVAALAEHPERDLRIKKAWKILDAQRPDLVITAAHVLIESTGDVPDEGKRLGDRIMAY